jgi:hypothetical protein
MVTGLVFSEESIINLLAALNSASILHAELLAMLDHCAASSAQSSDDGTRKEYLTALQGEREARLKNGQLLEIDLEARETHGLGALAFDGTARSATGAAARPLHAHPRRQERAFIVLFSTST